MSLKLSAKSASKSAPFALVTWWERYLVCVSCPYCSEPHAHIVGSPPYQGQFRTSGCRDFSLFGGQYVLLYPWESHHAAADHGWELDRENRTFRIVWNLPAARQAIEGMMVPSNFTSKAPSGSNPPRALESGLAPRPIGEERTPLSGASRWNPGRGARSGQVPGSRRSRRRRIPPVQVAFATLRRGGEYPPVGAMSGFTLDSTPEGSQRVAGMLDGDVWGRKAKALCRWMGHGTNGDCGAHVEKQLAAYFLDKHCVRFDFEGMLGRHEVLELHQVQPPVPREVTIEVAGLLVGKSCRDCARFFNVLNGVLEEVYGVKIEVKKIQTET